MNHIRLPRSLKHQPLPYLAVSLLVSTLLVVSLLSSTLPIAHAAGNITGTVFQDYNADGFQNLTASATLPAIDHGVGGVTVTAYNASGAAVGMTTTAPDGSYTLATTDVGSGPYRVEFTGLPTSYQPGAVGTSSGSSVQFVNAGGTANLGINEPCDYCQANPLIIGSRHIFKDTTVSPSTPAILANPYTTTQADGTARPAEFSWVTYDQVGNTWGRAYKRNTKDLFSAATSQRGLALGPGGAGAIYKTTGMDTAGAHTASTFTTIPNVGPVPSNAARGLANMPQVLDTQMYALTAKAGLGGLTISEDETTLYVMNLNDRSVYPVNAISGAVGAPIAITDPGCGASVYRPWALKQYRGDLYAGVVCEDASNAYVVKLAGPSFAAQSVVNTTPLNYTHDQVAAQDTCNNPSTATPPGITNWQAWSDGPLPTLCDPGASIGAWPTPVLTDLAFADNGDLLMGFADRFAMQMGVGMPDPNSGSAASVPVGAYSGGDILQATKSGSTWSAGSPTLYESADNFVWPTVKHGQISFGGLTLLPGSLEFNLTAFDPVNDNDRSFDQFGTGGVRTIGQTSGSLNRQYQLYGTPAGGLPNTEAPYVFGNKANGLGDIELLCDPAPIEIGNRVWNDADGDGVQDAGEAPIAGVTVQLVNSAGTVIGTAVTDANGNYLFSNSTAGASTTSAIYNLPITANTSYTVRVPTAQAALTSLLPTPANAPDTSAGDGGANADARDSDGTVSGAYSQILITTGNAGTNNHTYDFGFIPTTVSIGNQVWYDTDNNGQINGSEVGVDGVRVELFLDANGDGVLTGAEQTPVAVQTTNSGGYYLFTQTTDANGVGTGTALLPGQYIVGVAPSNFATGGVLAGSRSSGTTISNAGVVSETPSAANGTTDSNVDNADDGTTQTSGFYASGVLSGPLVVSAGGEPGGTTPGHPNTVNGTAIPNANSNPTVDFGFYRQTLGNLVFNDVNNDGVYTAATDTPITGATVKLFAADGITEIPVGPDGILGTADDAPGGVVTGASGTYLFANLPQGTYVVQVTAPAGYASSTDIASSTIPNGNTDNDDNGLGGGVSPVSSAPITLTPGSTGATNANVVDTTTGTTANPTLDFGFYTLSLGNLVWNDSDNDGLKDASETGVDGVTVNLYVDTNGNGILDAADMLAGTQTTSNGGHYLFTNLAPASYLVQLPPSNFQAGGPLAGYTSSTGTNGNAAGPYEPGASGAIDNDDNGTTGTGGIVSGPIALQAGTQPTNELDLGLPTGVTDPASNANSNLTIDFGVFQPASLGDYVWLDTDKDGVQDVAETGVDGVQVSLYTPNGKDGIPGNADDTLPIATTITGANPAVAGSHGYYHFANLAPDTDYTLRLDRPSDFTGAGPLAGYTLTDQDAGADDTLDSDAALIAGVPTITATTGGPGTDTPTFDFGFNTSAALGDYIWLDANNNGIQDAGETGINGVTVHLYDSAGTLVDTQITSTQAGSDGYVHFANLTPGTTYIVKLDNPADYAPGGPLESTTLSPAFQGSDTTLDSNATLVAGFPTISTATTGAPGSDTPTYDIGLYRPTASLGDYIWNDANKNGVQDVGETGINGVTVNLYDSAGNLVDTTTTATNGSALGYYHFTNLDPTTTYTIKLDNPADYAPSGPLAGFLLTPADQGGNDATDSDATTVAGFPTISAAPTGAAQSDTPTYDIGLYQPLSLGNLVWNDTNNDGLKGASEAGVDGVTVNLYLDTNGNGVLDASDTLVSSQTTSNGGHYLFTNLGQGTYLVQLDASNFGSSGLLAGYSSSTGDTGSATGGYEPGATSTADNDDNGSNRNGGIVSGPIVLAPGTQPSSEPDMGLPTGITDSALDSNSNLTVDFGVIKMGRLGDYVWYDTNNNGVQDAGETGVAGVTVTLYDQYGTPLATTTTAADGSYQFTNLPPGIYIVGYTNLPAGYTFAPESQGGNTASDSNASQATGRTLPITLGAGENNPTVDGGIMLTPTAITLRAFTATWHAGSVLVTWTTSAEIDTFGFHLLRSSDGTLAHATRVTPALIPAQGRGKEGASYAWSDTTVTRGTTYTYWLEETEVGGSTHIYGPVRTQDPTTAGTYRILLPVVKR